MQKLFLEKGIDLNHDLKELISIAVDDSINYKMERSGIRAIGHIKITGDYVGKNGIKTFNETMELDVLAPFEKVLDRRDFSIKIEDFDYSIKSGNINVVIEASVYGVSKAENRYISYEMQELDIDALEEQLEEPLLVEQDLLDEIRGILDNIDTSTKEDSNEIDSVEEIREESTLLEEEVIEIEVEEPVWAKEVTKAIEPVRAEEATDATLEPIQVEEATDVAIEPIRVEEVAKAMKEPVWLAEDVVEEQKKVIPIRVEEIEQEEDQSVEVAAIELFEEEEEERVEIIETIETIEKEGVEAVVEVAKADEIREEKTSTEIPSEVMEKEKEEQNREEDTGIEEESTLEESKTDIVEEEEELIREETETTAEVIEEELIQEESKTDIVEEAEELIREETESIADVVEEELIQEESKTAGMEVETEIIREEIMSEVVEEESNREETKIEVIDEAAVSEETKIEIVKVNPVLKETKNVIKKEPMRKETKITKKEPIRKETKIMVTEAARCDTTEKVKIISEKRLINDEEVSMLDAVKQVIEEKSNNSSKTQDLKRVNKEVVVEKKKIIKKEDKEALREKEESKNIEEQLVSIATEEEVTTKKAPTPLTYDDVDDSSSIRLLTEVSDEDTVDDEEFDLEAELFDDLEDESAYVSYHIYVVQPDDTYQAISDKYNIPVDLLKDYNQHMDLQLGKLVVIPYML